MRNAYSPTLLWFTFCCYHPGVHNHLFPPGEIALLLAPERWTVMSTLFPCDLAPVADEDRCRWALHHTERHPNREMLFVLEGEGFQSLGGSVYPVRPGTVLGFDSLEAHNQGYPANHPHARHLWLIFLPDRCVAMMVRVGRGRKGYTEQWRRVFSLQDLGLVSADVLFPRPADPSLPNDLYRVQITAGVALLMSRLLTHGYVRPPAEASRDFPGDVIAAIQRHIEECGGKDCRMADLARIAGYSKYHFHRIFRRHVGMTLGQYAGLCRRDAFARLTADGLRQKAIAEALGFAHPSALTRWRKRQRA